jgi:hypothetical protein
MLGLVPGRADPEVGPAIRNVIVRRGHVRDDRWMAVGDP